MKHELLDLEVVEISLTTAGANDEADVLIYKRAAPVAKACGLEHKQHCEDGAECKMDHEHCVDEDELESAEAAKGDEMTDDKIKALEADVAAQTERADKAEKQVAELRETIAKRQTPEEIEKAKLAALPEDIRKRLEDTEAEIRKMREEKSLATFIEKASAFKHLPIKAEAFGPVLKAASASMTADQVAELDRVLKAADEALRGAFIEVGRNAAPSGDDKDQFIAKVKEFTDKGDAADVAFGKAAKANPRLYNGYRASVALKS